MKRDAKGSGKGKRKKAKKALFPVESSGSSSFESSGLDIEWKPGEEETSLDEEDELFVQVKYDDLTAQVLGSLDVVKRSINYAKTAFERDVEGEEIRIREEIKGESDGLRSLAGSDEEIDP